MRSGCSVFPDCVDRAVCRGDCVRYMMATAAERNRIRSRIAALGNKKSRQQAAEREAKNGMEKIESVHQ